MYILVVAATHNEINTTLDWLKDSRGICGDHEVEALITGVGSAATVYALARQLQWRTPEMLIQAGIAGSFTNTLAPGSIVFVKDEVFADLGAFNGPVFDDIFDLGLAAADEPPYSQRRMVNPHLERWEKFDLPFVHAATVNCVSSLPHQIQAISAKYHPDIESMEGAAFHYTCLMEELPFVQIRTISNYVGERNKKEWKMKEAIVTLNTRLQELLTSNF